MGGPLADDHYPLFIVFFFLFPMRSMYGPSPRHPPLSARTTANTTTTGKGGSAIGMLLEGLFFPSLARKHPSYRCQGREREKRILHVTSLANGAEAQGCHGYPNRTSRWPYPCSGPVGCTRFFLIFFFPVVISFFMVVAIGPPARGQRVFGIFLRWG